MRRMLLTTILCLAMTAPAAPAAPVLACGHVPEEAMPVSMRMTLEQRVGQEVFQKAGLHKLTPEEQRELSAWIGQYTKKMTDFMEEYCRRRAAEAQAATPAQPKP
ncbi:MAG: hypothetical protein V1797_15035 [Pseudomonadota bacterium]